MFTLFKFLLALSILLLVKTSGFSQARIVLNDDAYITMDNSVYMVIENPNVNAITETGSGGRIVSEEEHNKIRWRIGTATGTYTLPWNSNPATSDTEIPLTFIVASAGSGGANQYVDFSTWEATGTTSAANTPWASGVTDMNNGGADNQDYVVDRWWWLGANNYTVKPTVRMTFKYCDVADETGGSNSLNEANLQAQRWDSGWDGSKIWGTVNTTANEVVLGVTETIADADFLDAWVLADNAQPLPVNLISFEAKCTGSSVTLNWTTASEINNDYFILQKTYDLVNFIDVASIQGMGTSHRINDYMHQEEESLNRVVYYRLKQVDFNGVFEYSNLISRTPCVNKTEFNIFPNPFNDIVHINLSNQNEAKYTLELSDCLGRIILRETMQASQKSHLLNLNHLKSKGVYFISIRNQQNRLIIHEKILKM
jgi:hypothetical protein